MSTEISYKLQDVYRELLSQFKANGIDTPDLDARIILEKRAGVQWIDLISDGDREIDEAVYQLVMQDMKLRIGGCPISRIYGEREFWGRTFKITEDTLDPRPDTELIIDLALKRFVQKQGGRVLDLGTGSGCILITLLAELSNFTGVGVDVSARAIEVAQENADFHDLSSRAQFSEGSWFDSVGDEKFDLIVSNPPYISSDVIPSLMPDVKNHDPILALDGGIDGLAPYKIIFSQLKKFLKPGGIALFEIGYDQGDSVLRLAEESGFLQRCVHMDMASNPRVVEISCGDK